MQPAVATGAIASSKMAQDIPRIDEVEVTHDWPLICIGGAWGKGCTLRDREGD